MNYDKFLQENAQSNYSNCFRRYVARYVTYVTFSKCHKCHKNMISSNYRATDRATDRRTQFMITVIINWLRRSLARQLPRTIIVLHFGLFTYRVTYRPKQLQPTVLGVL